MNNIRNIFIGVILFTLGFFIRNVPSFVFAHGGDTNLIHACVRPISGLLHIVGVNDTCGSNENTLDWQKAPKPGTDLPLICTHCEFKPEQGFPYDYFAGKNLTGAVLINSDMSGGLDLTGTNLTNGLLQAVSLYNANLTSTNLTGANLEGATQLYTATITNTIWSNTVCPDGTNSDNNGNTCEGHLTP